MDFIAVASNGALMLMDIMHIPLSIDATLCDNMSRKMLSCLLGITLAVLVPTLPTSDTFSAPSL
ncbi:MAG: hypothetical protein QXY14_04710 [Candidatus Nitrosocaldus sp.]